MFLANVSLMFRDVDQLSDEEAQPKRKRNPRSSNKQWAMKRTNKVNPKPKQSQKKEAKEEEKEEAKEEAKGRTQRTHQR